MSPTIGALCAGYGGLDLAVREVLGGQLRWVAEKDPAASKVLAHHWPAVPNLGDITGIDWSQVEPVDIVTAGFPCQDVSLAGRRAGLTEGTRSGLWRYIRDGLAVLRPSLVILENVRGLLSARADSDVEPCPWCLGDPADEPPLRALGAVLADLAGLGFDAEWVGLPASGVGACHGRFRVGVLAWPAADAERGERERELHQRWGSLGGAAATGRGPGSPADAHGDAVRLEPVAVTGSGSQAVAGLAGSEREPVADPDGPGREGTGSAGWTGEAGRSGADHGGPVADRCGASADAEGDGRDEGWPEPAGVLGGPDAAERGAAAPADTDGVRPLRGGPARGGGGGPEDDGPAASPHAHSGGLGPDQRHLQPGEPDAAGRPPGDAQGVGEQDEPLGGAAPGLDVEPVAGAVHRDRERASAEGVRQLGRAAPVLAWGPYEPAIRRWELTLGRPAPAPTEPGSKGQPRLSPRFVEWMQGLPEGWVCDVPGLSRNDQLRLLGNGVVPQQFAEVVRVLIGRAFGAVVAQEGDDAGADVRALPRGAGEGGLPDLVRDSDVA